jgi:hypothetical protein
MRELAVFSLIPIPQSPESSLSTTLLVYTCGSFAEPCVSNVLGNEYPRKEVL